SWSPCDFRHSNPSRNFALQGETPMPRTRTNQSNRAPQAGTVQPPPNAPMIPKARMAVYIGLGSLGCVGVEALSERYPEATPHMLGIDTESPKKSGSNPVARPAWRIDLLNEDVKKLAKSRRLPLLDDGLIPSLEYPELVSSGALLVRLFSTIK